VQRNNLSLVTKTLSVVLLNKDTLWVWATSREPVTYLLNAECHRHHGLLPAWIISLSAINSWVIITAIIQINSLCNVLTWQNILTHFRLRYIYRLRVVRLKVFVSGVCSNPALSSRTSMKGDLVNSDTLPDATPLVERSSHTATPQCTRLWFPHHPTLSVPSSIHQDFKYTLDKVAVCMYLCCYIPCHHRHGFNSASRTTEQLFIW
jgi:hypothetical protein